MWNLTGSLPPRGENPESNTENRFIQCSREVNDPTVANARNEMK